MDQKPITDDTLLSRHVAVKLCNELGYHITYSGLAVADHRQKGPIQTRFGAEIWYRMDNLRDWLEQRLECTLRQAVERGRLTVPAHLAGCVWDCDGSPIEPSKAE